MPKTSICAAFGYIYISFLYAYGLGSCFKAYVMYHKRPRGKQSHALPTYARPQQHRPGLSFCLEACLTRRRPRQNLANALYLARSTIARHLSTRGSHPPGRDRAKEVFWPPPPATAHTHTNIRRHIRNQLPRCGPSNFPWLSVGPRTAALSMCAKMC